MTTKTKRRSQSTGTQMSIVKDMTGFSEKRKPQREMEVTEEMRKVKNFFWAIRKKSVDITPEEAALHCEIRPSTLEIWFNDLDVKAWFFLQPVKSAQVLDALSNRALSVCDKLLECHDPAVREKATRYLIDQGIGKAKDKREDLEDEDEDGFDIESAVKELEKLKKRSKDD